MSGLVVIDYGAGNTGSVLKALRHIGAAPAVARDAREIRSAERVVFPGVGHFGAAMAGIQKLGIVEAVRDVLARGVPVLGVCLGLQVLFEGSDEAPEEPGLGLLPGRCKRFDEASPDGTRLKVPQIGWNRVRARPGSFLFHEVAASSFFYFVHSYYAIPEDETVVTATSDYGVEYCVAVERGRLAAVQFHPEKSGPAGLKLLESFLRLPGA